MENNQKVSEKDIQNMIALDGLLLNAERNGILYTSAAVNTLVLGLMVVRFFSKTQHDRYEFLGVIIVLMAFGIAGTGIANFLKIRSFYRQMLQASHLTGLMVQGGVRSFRGDVS